MTDLNNAAPLGTASLESVYSAPAMLRLQPSTFSKQNPEKWLQIRAAIIISLDVLRARVKNIVGMPIEISLLFNAFTEEKMGHYIVEMDQFGFEKVYADSGGLQMVTTNREITPELKAQIYKTQRIADYGFCFDEIPLGIKEGVDPETAKHRSQTGSKIFKQQDFARCIAATAENIRDQTEAFEGAKTKAFYILQGNSAEEMYQWFEGGTSVLEPAHYKKIQGLAPADTCMGNGELESVEMLTACHRLHNDFPDYVGNHIHFLGVGSPSRLLPVIFLAQGGYLDKDTHVSFDSSTASMSLIMGNLVMPDGRRVRRGVKETVGFMTTFYDEMHDTLAETCGEIGREEFYAHVLKYHKSIADLINNAPPHMEVWLRAAVSIMPLWQVVGFFQSAMNSVNSPEKHYSALGFLRQVKTEDDMNHWRRQFSRYLKSSRIDRVVSNTLVF